MDLGMSVCISRGMVRVSTDRGIGRSMDGVLESWEEVKVEACSHAWLESALAEVSGGGLVGVMGAGMCVSLVGVMGAGMGVSLVGVIGVGMVKGMD